MHRAPEARLPLWDRVGGLVSHRRSWVLALVIAALGGALLGLIPPSNSAQQSPVVLPPSAESVRATEEIKKFPGGNTAPVLLVISRADGGDLSPDELTAAQQARDRMADVSGVVAAPGPPVIPATDGKAAVAPVALNPDLNGFALSDTVTGLRDAARDGLPVVRRGAGCEVRELRVRASARGRLARGGRGQRGRPGRRQQLQQRMRRPEEVARGRQREARRGVKQG
jgi:RND superfamily putative drug exporter